MRLNSRTILAFLVAWSVVFVPLAHSAAMDMRAMDTSGTHQHAGAAAAHHHDEQAASHEHDCHHESEKDQKSPASTDGCGMCQSHPICHTVVLLEQPFVFAALPVGEFEIGGFPAAAIHSYKPAIQPPRI